MVTITPDSYEAKSDSERLLDAMYGEVTHTLGLAATPRGILAKHGLERVVSVVPLSESSSLVGVDLPVRAKAQALLPGTPNIVGDYNPEQDTLVVKEDLVSALVRAGRFEAAEYWEHSYDPQSLIVIHKEPIGMGSFIEHVPQEPTV